MESKMWVSIVYFLFVIMSLDLLHGDINVKPTIQTLKCTYCVQSGRGRNIKSFLPFFNPFWSSEFF